MNDTKLDSDLWFQISLGLPNYEKTGQIREVRPEIGLKISPFQTGIAARRLVNYAEW